MKNKISIAIIGGGLNSAVGYAHFSAINLSNKFKIVAGSFSKSTEINKESSNLESTADFSNSIKKIYHKCFW